MMELKFLWRLFLIGTLAGALVACGFHLRGERTLPFTTISVSGTSQVAKEMKRAIEAGSNARVVESPTEAEAVFSMLREANEKVILSLNSEGRVREYQLRYLASYQVVNPKGGYFIAPTTVVLTRDITFNDQILAKETEESQLYRDMRSDFVQQALRRMSIAKPVPAEPEKQSRAEPGKQSQKQ